METYSNSDYGMVSGGEEEGEPDYEEVDNTTEPTLAETPSIV